MKSIKIIIALICISLSIQAQEEQLPGDNATSTLENPTNTDNFFLKSNEIVWQKVYQTEKSFEEIVKAVQLSGNLQEINIVDSVVISTIKPMEIDYKGYGLTEMSCPISIARNRWTGTTTIEYREGRYRVTVKNIESIRKYSDPLFEEGEVDDLSYYVRSGDIKPKFSRSKMSELLNYGFEPLYDFTVEVEESW